MNVPKKRLLELMKVQCRVFATTYNPERVRTGNKILRQRLRGPALAAYYPRKAFSIKEVINEFGPELMIENEDEIDRLEHIDALKARGKGAPKKLKGPPDLKKGKK